MQPERLLLFLIVLLLGCEPKLVDQPASSTGPKRALVPSSAVPSSAGPSSADSSAPTPTPAPSAPEESTEAEEGARPVQAAVHDSKSKGTGKATTRDSYRLPSAKRLVAIGDLHGDLRAANQALSLAGAVDDQGRWAGGDLTVVQTGDQLDRGDDEQEILMLLDRLGREAKLAGGRLIVLNGNHETMNVLGDYRYVTPGALSDFHGLAPTSPYASQVTGPFRERAEAFLPGGAMALVLARRPLVAMVGKTVFAHGGVTPGHVRYGIDRLNRETGEFMRGESATPPAPVVSEDGPLWTRIYGEANLSESACATLQQTLKLLGAERMVVGHTVQRGGVTSSCDGRVYKIDVGLAAHYGGRKIEVLEIQEGKVRVLSAPRVP